MSTFWSIASAQWVSRVVLSDPEMVTRVGSPQVVARAVMKRFVVETERRNEEATPERRIVGAAVPVEKPVPQLVNEVLGGIAWSELAG